jgi:PAS domain-containing protein
MVVVRPAARSGDSDWSGLFRSAFRKSRNAMALVDHGRVLVDVNGAFVHLVGHKRAEVVGRPVGGFVVGAPRCAPTARASPCSGTPAPRS